MKRLLFVAIVFAVLCAGWTWDDGSNLAPIPADRSVDVTVKAPAAHKETTDPRLDALASKIAGRAIKRTGRTIRWLGGDDDAVGTLIPYALAIHWRIAARYQDYYLESCNVPNWW